MTIIITAMHLDEGGLICANIYLNWHTRTLNTKGVTKGWNDNKSTWHKTRIIVFSFRTNSNWQSNTQCHKVWLHPNQSALKQTHIDTTMIFSRTERARGGKDVSNEKVDFTASSGSSFVLWVPQDYQRQREQPEQPRPLPNVCLKRQGSDTGPLNSTDSRILGHLRLSSSPQSLRDKPNFCMTHLVVWQEVCKD